MNLFTLAGLLSGLSSLVLACFILSKAKDRVHYIWSIFLLSVSLWGWGLLGFSAADSKEQALLWWRIAEIGIIMIPISLTHFILEFLDLVRKRQSFLFLSYSSALVFILINIFSDFFISKLTLASAGFYYIIPTPYYVIFITFFITLFIYNLSILLSIYKHKLGREKLQVKFLLIAVLFGLVGGFLSYSLIFGAAIYPIWNATIFISALIISYTIVRYRLLDIKFVMRRYSIYTLSMTIVFIPALLIKLITIGLKESLGRSIDMTFLLIAILIFPYIKSKTAVFANKFFFSSLYESKKLIAEVSEKLRSTLKISEIYNYIYSSIDGAMHVKSFGILRYDEKKAIYSTQYNINFNIGRRVNFERNDVLQGYFENDMRYLLVAEAKKFEEDLRTRETLSLLHEMNVELMLPLSIKKRVVGLIVLGAKESGDIYNDEDLQILSIIASQSAMAIENATLYEGTKNFSLRMENEVKRATSDLRVVNERLKKLDEAKSEFISIASHQLRTPLTIIKGYISMMLEGSFGVVSKLVKESLEKVYESNERLISLVDNLLNISRIESGHLKFNFEKVSMENMVKDMVMELSGKAEEKGLELVFKMPVKALPEIVVDAEKMRQVIMNLIDNSIKYTNKGMINVEILEKNKKIFFSVSDKGIGIKKEDIPNLFKKFSRGTGAMLEHTEGTGLGLFVAKQMIDAHKGNIWIESEGEGKGAKFCFELPIGLAKDDLTKLTGNITI